MASLYSRPRLGYPAGYRMGFDPSHPLSQNCVFSGVALAGGFVSLLSGAKGAEGGSPTNGIGGLIGPYSAYTANANHTFSLGVSAIGSNFTAAAILQCPATTGSPQYAFNNAAAGNTGFGFNLTFSGFGLVSGNGSQTAVLPLVVGRYYCVIASINASVMNIAAVDLLSGQTYNGTSATVGGTPTGDGTLYLGNRGLNSRQLNGPLSSLVISNVFLSLPQMLQLLQNPWAPWYPQSLPWSYVGISGTPPSTLVELGGMSVVSLGYTSNMVAG